MADAVPKHLNFSRDMHKKQFSDIGEIIVLSTKNANFSTFHVFSTPDIFKIHPPRLKALSFRNSLVVGVV